MALNEASQRAHLLVCPWCGEIACEGTACYVRIEAEEGTFHLQSGHLNFTCRHCGCASVSQYARSGRLYLARDYEANAAANNRRRRQYGS